MGHLKYYLYEGIFRRPRLWSNDELRKFAHLFRGSVVNVSAWKDLDKSVDNHFQYFFGNYDSGIPYKNYFTNASRYSITNYPQDANRGSSGLDDLHYQNYDEILEIDLEKDLPRELIGKFDVVFNHTVLEHVFDIGKAFENLCLMSKDIVIVVVPFVQMVHDYGGSYRDYWRLTPFALEKLFDKNGLTVLYRGSTKLYQSSIYYFFIGTKNPERWKDHFRISSLEEQLPALNLGWKIFLWSHFQYKLEYLLRKIAQFFSRDGRANKNSE